MYVCVWYAINAGLRFGWPGYFVMYVVNRFVEFGWPNYFVSTIVSRIGWFLLAGLLCLACVE